VGVDAAVRVAEKAKEKAAAPVEKTA